MSGDGLVKPQNAPPGISPYPGVQPGTNNNILRARLVIVSGAGDGVFVYNGTPGLGNPPIAWMGSGFVDPYGNVLPSTTGVASTGTFQAGDTIINTSGVFIYNGTPANGTLLAGFASAAGTDSFGNSYPFGTFGNQITITNSSGVGGKLTAAATTGVTQYTTPQGLTGQITLTKTNASTLTNANNGTQPITTSWNIPAGDGAAASTSYEVWVPVAGVTGTASTGILSFKPYLNLTAVTTSGGDGIGATAIAAGVAFTAKIRVTLVVQTAGSSGTAAIYLDGGYTEEVNVQASGSSNFLSSQATGLAYNTTVANTLGIAAVWASNIAGQSVGSLFSRFTRSGP